MCMGRTHAAVGGAVGLAYSEHAHLPWKEAAYLTVFTAGLAVLPDIDHLKATMARSFGFVTWLLAWTVGHVSGGHRNGTHSFLGAGVLTALALAAVRFRHDWPARAGLCLLLALTFAAVFCATFAGKLAIKELCRIPGLRCVPVKHVTEATAVGLAVLLAVTGWGLGLFGLATILGCLAHIGTDMITKERCPLLWPFSRIRFGLLPEDLSITTDTWQEHWIVMPLTGAAFAVLCLYGAFPGFCLGLAAHIHHAI